MVNPRLNHRGVVLFIVLGTIMAVVILSAVILNIMSSQSRLTHHQVSRIQAYYASWAGVNYAYDMLRSGNWAIPGSTITRCLCRDNTCSCPGGTVILEPNLPNTIQRVVISVIAAGANCNSPSGPGSSCISATADYTYQ